MPPTTNYNRCCSTRTTPARAFAAQTLARLMIAQRRVRPEIWNNLVTAIERQVNSHQVGDMLAGIRLLAQSPLARPLTQSIRGS
ncbi:MAG: hypothetical protein HZY76_01870 [Anaerolineae bacterium]|nr:MAG: hypothetical protein HZY76_01870 [Anaerolineae bacterium]